MIRHYSVCKQLFILIAAVFPFLCQAAFYVVDENGRQVQLKFTDTPYTRFQKSYSFEDFQQLDSTDREYAIPETLRESLNPNSKLTGSQKTGMRLVLAQYYESMSPAAKEAVERKVFWMAFLSGQPSLALKAGEKFLSPYPEQRAQQLCRLVRDSTQMLLYTGVKASFQYLMKLGQESMGVLASLIDSKKDLGGEKCPLDDNDDNPLSLREMRAELVKSGLLPTVKDTATTAPKERPRTPCQISKIKSIFQDAITSIEMGGQYTRVYLGMNTMTCPIYGLVLRDPKSLYRYYPDSYREDIVPAIRFKSADDIAAIFQIIPASEATAVKVKNIGNTSK